MEGKRYFLPPGITDRGMSVPGAALPESHLFHKALPDYLLLFRVLISNQTANSSTEPLIMYW